MRKNDIFAAINNTNMGSWTIYNKSGVAKAVVKELELHDEWMAECYLTITVKSAQPISFAVGDYIDYRNERYTIEYDPNEIKKSTSGTYGEGFVYENIKFVGAQDEVVRCDFNDIVLSDNNVHYTALPTFPFYCESVDDLLDRIQANLEELYPNGWIVIGLNTVRNYQRGNIVGRAAAFEAAYRQWVDPDLTPRTDPYGKQSVAETADNITCWDALTKVHDDFGLNFIVRGKVIIVGTAGVFTANTFRYGKGNGLSEIEKLGDSSQQIVTRLRAYGSETNMPLHYYSAINMLPYGLAIGSTTDGNVQIDVDFKKEYFVHEFSSGETDVVAKVGNIEYNAKAYINGSTGKINLNLRVAVSVTANAKVYITEGVKRDMWPSDHKDYAQGALPENMAVSRLMLPMFPNQSLYDWVKAHRDTGTTYDDATGRATYHGYTAYFSKEPQRPYIDSLNKDDYGIRPASIYFDGSNDTVDIHPTIEGMTYNSNPIDVIYDAEQIDDNGVYDDSSVTVPNFNITLPNLGFNLAEVYEENASIDVKDGMCGGRSFKIASKPTQDANGRWVCECQRAKDDSLALFFPYNDFQIASGDHYVLTGIQLPDEYISAASVRMVDATLDALFKNHAPRLTYQPKIDYNFMQRQHDTAMASQGVVSLHDTLKAGDVFVFADADMGIDKSVIIDQLTIKENGEKGIPTYEISLRDEKDVSPIQKLQNKIDSVISGAININGGGSGLTPTQVRSLINNYGGEQFLSKLNNDTAAGYITMLKGLQIGANFVPDILGEGGVLRMREDGKVELVTDILYARVKAYFDSVEIREYQHTGGNRIASVAGNKICRVAWFNSSNVELEQTQANLASVAYFRCYFRASDGEDTVRNNWVVGDQAYCHITSVTTSSDNPEQKGLNQKHLWRLVIGRNTEGTLTEDGEAYIDLSNRATETISGNSYTGYQSGSDIPEAQDDTIQLGNVNDTTRQGAIVEFVTGTDAPSYQIYQGINSFSLNNKNQIGFGYNTGTGRAYLNVYGDFRFGSRNDNESHIKYNQATKQLDIKANVTFTNVDEMSQFVKDNQNNYNDAWVHTAVEDLQSQIDGEIDSWFYNYLPVADLNSKVPLTNKEPYKTWYETDGGGTASEVTTERTKHLGDTFYDNSSGYAFRFSLNENTEDFEWNLITDSAVVQALANAAKAQETADGKRTTYSTWNAWMKNNVNTLEVGDLFIPAANTTQGGVTYKAKKVYKCTTDGSATFQEVDYTDDTRVNGFINELLNGQTDTEAAMTAAIKAIRAAVNDGKTTISGGLVLTNEIAMRDTAATPKVWSGISGMYDANVLGGGIASWWGGARVDHEVSPSVADYAKSLVRFDGSGYFAGGNITWDAQGRVAIKDITTLIGNNNTNVLNELTTFNNAFHFTTSQGSSTILSISPQAGFDSLSILENGTLKPVATQEWVNQNFVTTTFFDNLFRVYNGAESAANKIEVNGTIPSSDNLNIEAMFGFWTKKYITALGQGDDGSTSYTTLAQLNDVQLGTLVNGDALVYNSAIHKWENKQIEVGVDMSAVWAALLDNTNEQINISHLATALSNYITSDNLSTTLTGYATIVQLNALEFLNQVTGGDGVLKLITNKSTEYDVDLSHEHSFLELLDRPDTITGYGVTLTADDIPMLTKSKISDFPTTWAWSAITGKPNSIAGYGILDAKIENGVITLGGNSIAPLISETYRGTVVSVGLSVPAGFSVSGTPITDSGTLAIAFASGYEGFTTDLKNKINALFSWFEVDANGNIKTKDYTENNETKHRGFYSPSFISALGMGDDGQAGQGDVTWALLASPATDGRTIHSSYLTAVLAGYATQNWVQQQGYITSAQLSALEYLQTITGGNEVATFTTNLGTETVLDFSHEHSWFELLDKPDTITGLGVALSASDIPNLDWSKITTGKPSTLAGYGITDAVAFVAIGGVNYSPVSGVVTLPVYTSTQVDALARLKTLALSDDGVLSFTHQDDSTTLVDFTHEHSFLELLDRPETIKGYGITIEASDIPNLDWSKITTGKPTTLAGYGITDAKIANGVITLGASSITPVTSVAMSMPTGFSVSGSPISKTGTLAVSYASGYEGFTTDLKNKINTLFSWFEVDNDGNIKTKDYTDGGTTKHRGFYSPSFISALGQGDDGTAGTGDVTWALLATQATGGRTIHLSYISAALASYLTTNGYLQTSAIADMATRTWVGQQGFLTSSSLSNYYTKTEVDALPRIKAIALSSDGCLSFTWQNNTSTIADYSHEHSWFELLDRPDTLAGYGVTLTANDIPSIPKSKISDFPTSWAWSAITGKPTTVSGYGITDAITTANIGSQSVNYATSAGSAGTATTAGSTNKLTTLSDITYGANYLQYQDVHASAASNPANAIGNPSADWYHHIVMNHGNSAGYFVDMAICFHSNDFYYRRIVGGSANNWVRVIDSSNIGNQSVSSASSAGYATSAGNADTVDGYHESAFLHLSGGTMSGDIKIGNSTFYASGSNGGINSLAVADDCILGDCNIGGHLGLKSLNTGDAGIAFYNLYGTALGRIYTSGSFTLYDGSGNNATLNVGNLYSTGAVSALSDIRHKEIVRNTNLRVEQIAAMRSVIYRKKDSNDNTLYAGSIAQDWQSILPQVVSVADNDEHTQSLQYGVAALIAVITTARKVAEHERRIADLERENERLKEIINNLNIA